MAKKVYKKKKKELMAKKKKPLLGPKEKRTAKIYGVMGGMGALTAAGVPAAGPVAALAYKLVQHVKERKKVKAEAAKRVEKKAMRGKRSAKSQSIGPQKSRQKK